MAGLAMLLSVGWRYHRLLNLSVGALAFLGAWIVEFALGLITGARTNALWPILGTMAVSIALVVLVARRLEDGSSHRNPVWFVFSSLGLGILIETSLVLFGIKNFSSTISIPLFDGYENGKAAIAIVALWTFIVAYELSPRAAKTVLHGRTAERNTTEQKKLAKHLVALLLCQFVAALAFGAVFGYVHGGSVGLASTLAIVPVIACLVANGISWLAALLALGVSLATTILTMLAPSWLLGHELAMSIGLLVICLATVRFPYGAPYSARTTDVPTARQPPWFDREEAVLSILALAIAILTIFDFANSVYEMLRVLIYVTCTWFVLRHLGVMTITAPLVGGAAATIAAKHGATSPIFIVGVLFVLFLFCGHVYLLRLLPAHTALVVDLAIAVMVQEIIRRSSRILGEDNFLNVRVGPVGTEHAWGIVLSIAIIIIVAAAWYLRVNVRARTLTYALSNYTSGLLNGFSVVRGTFAIVFCVGVATALGGFSYHAYKGSVTIQAFRLTDGLASLLLAYIGHKRSLCLSYTGAFLLYGVLAQVFSGFGVVIELLIGSMFCLGAIRERFSSDTNGGHQDERH